MNESVPSLPMSLGGYRIVGPLGKGAMADVYEAEDSTGHRVALKVFRAGGGMSFTMIERFRREAEATKKLRRHPYILTVYATGNEGEYHYIAMERVEESRSLESLMKKESPVDLILNIGIKISAALEYAHEHQVIHRDVKPSNILLDDFQEPMLTDFGVAELRDWPSLTLSGTLTGTPMYMAPEQAKGQEVSPASDVYSLAVVLYEALAGRMPYDLPEPPSTPAILDAVKNQQPISLRKTRPHLSRDLNYVIMRALRKSPGERYESAREFGHDLECVLENKPVAGRWTSPWMSMVYWFRRHRTLLAGMFAFLLFSAAMAGVVREQLRESTHRELIQMALKTSRDMKLARMSSTNRTDPEMRSARRAMLAGRWLESRDLLQTAAGINRELGLPIALAEARIELARTETMLHNSLRARELYEQVWRTEEASPALRQIAAFECMLLMLLDGRHEEARFVKQEMETLQMGPYILLMEVALGDPLPENWENTRATWQTRLRWNAGLAEVVRHRGREERQALLRRLDELIREGDHPMIWPLPLAAYLKGRIS